VSVRGEESVELRGPVGKLDARAFGPEDATHAVVICHPHPLYGGSMHSPVPLSIAKALAERPRTAFLRFNFRGVPASEGQHDHGVGEIDDVAAAIALLRSRAPRASLCVCGHSFGSWVGLKAAARDGGVDRVALIGPSIRFFEFSPQDGAPFAGRLAIFIGDEDEFCDPDEARTLATALGAELRLFQGFDHHFMKSRRTLAEAVVPFLAPEASM
jgi:alpha/beta superfamily hydrolase